MRKTAVFAVLIAVAAAFTACKKKSEPAREGLVNFVTGQVFIDRNGSKKQAQVGDVIRQGMKIQTQEKSFIDIYIGENAVKVLENTEVEVNTLLFDAETGGEKTSLKVQRGDVITRVSKKLSKHDSYSISTPTTIAAVRGTEFMVSEKDGAGQVACLDGLVRVSDASDADKSFVDIEAGQEVKVEPGKPLTVQELSEENKKRLQGIISEISEIRQDIRRRFEEQREQIRKQVSDQRDRNREMVEKLKDENKKMVEDQKAQDKANIEAIKGSVDEEKEAVKGGVDSAREDSKKQLEGVKPEIKKFGIDSVKPQVNKFSADIEKK